MALIFGLVWMKANWEQSIYILLMQPTHQKKALWTLILMILFEIGFGSKSGQDRRFQEDQKNRLAKFSCTKFCQMTRSLKPTVSFKYKPQEGARIFFPKWYGRIFFWEMRTRPVMVCIFLLTSSLITSKPKEVKPEILKFYSSAKPTQLPSSSAFLGLNAHCLLLVPN